MKSLRILCLCLLSVLLFVGCNIATEKPPQKVDITLVICENNSLKKCLVREEVFKEIKNLVLVMQEQLTKEDIETIVKSVCVKYGLTDIQCCFTDFWSGIQISLGDNRIVGEEYVFEVLIP